LNALTGGFLDPHRGLKSNAELFVALRDIAIESFERERVCDLSCYSFFTVKNIHHVFPDNMVQHLVSLRDSYYDLIREKDLPIRFPDLQSYFLYSFTKGINLFWTAGVCPKDSTVVTPIRPDDILDRRFPILGPEWLCDAANREMPSVENVFCDFQNELLVPVGQRSPDANFDRRLLADAVAGAFLWAFVGGSSWMREIVVSIKECLDSRGGDLDPSGFALYPVKKSMQLISDDEIIRIMASWKCSVCL
jgi:hypothetical protein